MRAQRALPLYFDAADASAPAIRPAPPFAAAMPPLIRFYATCRHAILRY
jgi:hypothetical protein